jgi:anthranilate phosphoribosyltransferase
MNIRLVIEKLIHKQNLESEEVSQAFHSLMSGELTDPLIASFLTAFASKGYTSLELTAAVGSMLNHSKKVELSNHDFIDTCGTGGDGKGTLNVSTLSALCLSSLGHSVVKHGNRSVSSVSGSSDVLAGLGYKIHEDGNKNLEEFQKHRFTFLFAPHWHPAMKYVGPVRKELGFRTIFNLLGPLSNPWKPNYQIIGVYHDSLLDLYAGTLSQLGRKRALVCHSRDGMDEFSLDAPTDYRMIESGEIRSGWIDPNEVSWGKNMEDSTSLFVSSPEEAISKAKMVLQGVDFVGTRWVALNGGVALWVMGKSPNWIEGTKSVFDQILSGKVEKYFSSLLGS